MIGLLPLVKVESRAASSAPKDINGNEWSGSGFVQYYSNKSTLFPGTNRVIWYRGFRHLYGSTLKDGKYPLFAEEQYFGSDWKVGTDNFDRRCMWLNVSMDRVDDTWIMEYYDTTSNADRYLIRLSNGTTYLKDNTGSLPTSGGDMTVTAKKSQATAWDIRLSESSLLPENTDQHYSIGHDISNADPHFIINDESNGSYSLDLSRKTTDYFQLLIEMPWYQTKFCNENGSEYKQDTRQMGTFEAPAGPAKTGYTFVGWTDTKGGNNIVYKKGDNVKPTSSKNYYPVYSVNSYSVRFYRDSTVSGGYEEQSFTYDKAQKLIKNTYTSPGGSFTGWANAADSTKTYVDGENVKNLTGEANGIVKLYALWDEISYTVQFSPNYGTGSVSPKTVRYSESFTLPDNTAVKRDGYELIGWNTKADGSGAGYSFGQTANKLTNVENDTVTLYAIWEKVHTHTAGVWQTVRAATCIDSGEKVRRCTDCDAIVEIESIDPLDHIEGSCSIINKEATCNGLGEKVWYCERCGIPVRTEAVSATDHIEGKAQTVILPTCTSQGISVIRCEKCNVVIREEKLSKLDHKPGDFVTVLSPTCTSEGREEQKCENCSTVISQKAIDPLPHSGEVWITTIQPTCVTAGERVCKCEACNDIYKTERLDPLDHIEGSCSIINKEATCNGLGEKVWYCERCGIPVRTEAVSATDHIEGKAQTVILPTCTSQGISVIRCEKCNVVIREEKLSKLDHKPGDFVTVLSPTCTSEGREEQKCENCSTVISQKAIDPLPHSGEVWITTIQPTCVTAGERVCKCEACNDIYKTERLDPLDHKPGKEHTCTDDQTCTVCGTVLEKGDGRSHTWSEWETSKKATFFSERKETRFCTSCNKEESRFVKGSAGCHKLFPHRGDGASCTACQVLYNINMFFRRADAFLFGWIRRAIGF